MENSDTSIKRKVIEKIESDKISMRPKWHFVLKTVLGFLGVIIVILTLVYLASFFLFVWRSTGVLFAPSLGFFSIGIFLVSIPKFLLIACIAFLVILEILVRRFSFGYRRPLLFSLLFLVLLVCLASYAVFRVGFHPRVFRFAAEHRLPGVLPFYSGSASERVENIYPGIILRLTKTGAVMSDRQGEEFEIYVTPETRLPFGFDFEEGDEIVVIGDKQGNTITAKGLRRFDFKRPPSGRGSNWMFMKMK